MDPIQKAREELADLSRQRERIDVRMTELQQFLRVYQSLAQPQLPLEPKPEGLEPRSKGERVIQAATEILSDGVPRSTRALLVELEKRGVKIGGTDEVANLSAILSRDKQRFQASRAVGWSLKTKAPESAGTPTGAFEQMMS